MALLLCHKPHVGTSPFIVDLRPLALRRPRCPSCMFPTLAMLNSTTWVRLDSDDDDHYHKKVEITDFLGKDWLRQNILPMLKPVEKSWQPQDFLPDSSCDGFSARVHELQKMNKQVPDEYFVVLAGNMITEEALPTYVSFHKTTDAVGTTDRDSAWPAWTRGWSAEENRHGDLLNRYLYLSGRVDMKQLEKTIHYLIQAGMGIGAGKDPYHGFVYSCFQERATYISHLNIAKLASHYGDTKLAQICGIIAADEKRHEASYSKIVSKVFELDPDGMMVSLAHMIQRKITMPAHFMYDGHDEKLFAHFSSVASRTGVYTVMDYINVLEHLLSHWNVDKLGGLSSQGREAQEFLGELPAKLRRREKAHASTRKTTNPPAPIAFSWIFNKQV